jgi:hypothetical protein
VIAPTYRRLTEEDLADAPKGGWKSKLMYAYNLFIQQMISGLSNSLTPEQNCISQTKTFHITGSATPANNKYSFVASYSYLPIGYDLLNIQPLDGSTAVFSSAPYVSWQWINGVFSIVGISGLTTGVPYTITIRVWWGAQLNT